ncbi:hypothetical protein [Pelomonas sp. SE-A7]|uniref:hypothetical protein n=1 Tax=Pelomonas sp. SE-A7 TaxID=3054953 RepID=UPI00259D287B|nr:hypothetical protein [Pelomonas sp. SE-A7]MDM4764606.1 hypothetical protein [Pelomonas sp. SE-A7]
MNKFPIKSCALAIASICASAAFAGTITLPATSTKYAVESLVGTTDITLPTIRYQMGVARTTAQDFTVIVKPTAGATFTAASCTAALPTITLGGAATGAFTPTIKRASTTECAYEVDVTTAFSGPAGADLVSLNFPGLVLDTHTLNIAGNTGGVTVGLWDLGETARIDNSADVTATAALSGNALTLTASSDTATTADVNNTNGPLYGFVAGGAAPVDTTSVASAKITVNNNSGATTWLKPDGATAWEFTVDGTSLAVTISGTNFTGLHATTPVTVTPTAGAAPTVTTGASSATFTLLPANFNAANTAQDVIVNMTAAGNTSLGTSRSFGVSVLADVVTGADETLAGGNTSWWTWTANAVQLSAPYFSTDNGAGVVTSFIFQNVGPATVYSASCQAETGKTVTAGTAATGNLAAGQTVIDAKDVCSFSAGIRGSVTFTINAPVANIKGTYNLSLNGGAAAFLPMQRPYGNNNTSNGSSF